MRRLLPHCDIIVKTLSRMTMRSERPTTSTPLRETPVRRRSVVPSEPESQARPDRLPWRRGRTPAAQLPQWTDEMDQRPHNVDGRQRFTRTKRPIFESEDEEDASPTTTVSAKRPTPVPSQEPQEVPPEITKHKKKKDRAEKHREAATEVTVTQQEAVTTPTQSGEEHHEKKKKKKKKKEKEVPSGLASLVVEVLIRHQADVTTGEGGQTTATTTERGCPGEGPGAGAGALSTGVSIYGHQCISNSERTN